MQVIVTVEKLGDELIKKMHDSEEVTLTGTVKAIFCTDKAFSDMTEKVDKYDAIEELIEDKDLDSDEKIEQIEFLVDATA